MPDKSMPQAVHAILNLPFQKRLHVLSELANALLSGFAGGKNSRIKAKADGFFQDLLQASSIEEQDAGTALGTQILCRQAMNVLDWMAAGVPGAERYSLTSDESAMVRDKDKSFVDKNRLPEGIPAAGAEGKPGFYDRGWEGVKKLGANVVENFQYDKSIFEGRKDKTALYLMTHGWMAVPAPLLKETEIKRISTIHQTSFIHFTLPGSVQTASTGPGHAQGANLDIKEAVSGRGVQFNLRYQNGKIADVIAQRLEPGSISMALPGFVDRVTALDENFTFRDFSIALNDSELETFKTAYRTGETPASVMHSGYEGALTETGTVLYKNGPDIPDIRWIMGLSKKELGENSLTDTYQNLTPEKISALIKNIGTASPDVLKAGKTISVLSKENILKSSHPKTAKSKPVTAPAQPASIQSLIDLIVKEA